MPEIHPFTDAEIEGVSKVLEDTDTGLSGSESGRLLSSVRISDVDSAKTKWKRVRAALLAAQNKDRYSASIFSRECHCNLV